MERWSSKSWAEARASDLEPGQACGRLPSLWRVFCFNVSLNGLIISVVVLAVRLA